MRRRWYVPEGFRFLLIGVYCIGWLPIYLGLYAVLVPGGLSGSDDTMSPIFFGCWFGVPVLVGGAVTAPRWARWLWSVRPRRVTEPVTEDLRADAKATSDQ